MRRLARRAGYAVLLAGALAGCKREPEAAAGEGTVTVDTANPSPLDGVSDAELKRQAQGLTPEQAAAAGVAVDTTIHVEDIQGQDTVKRAVPPTDSVP
jgi:hypothetical protein